MSAQPQCPNAELAVGWALHALEPADEDLLIEHLSDCHICREVVQQTEELFWVLSSANEQIDPRPQLRDELMAAVAATPQTPKEEREAAWPKASGMPAGSSVTVGWHADNDPGATSRAVDRPGARRKPTRRRRMAVLAATVVLAVVGVGGFAYRQVQTARQEQQVQAASPRQFNAIREQVALPGAGYAVLKLPNGEPVAGVSISATEREVYPYSLPPNNKQHVYVLWGIAKGAPVPLGAFDVNSSDNGLRRIESSAGGNGTFRAYAISLEPGRTMPETPSSVVASGPAATG
jgi:Anti-sigma-K factor rskA